MSNKADPDNELDVKKQRRNQASGMARAEASAGRKWQDRAVTVAKRYPFSGTFLVEDLRVWAYKNGLRKPPSGNNWCWGPLAKRLIKEGVVQPVGQGTTKNPKCHSVTVGSYKMLTCYRKKA